MAQKPLLQGRGWRIVTRLMLLMFTLMLIYSAFTLIQALMGGA